MNAPSSHEYYMTGDEIATAISDVSALAAEVIKHNDHLQLVHGTVYQSRGMTPRFLRTKRPYVGNFSGYDFSKVSDSSELIVPQGSEVLIATKRWRRNQYELHPLSDYVAIWVIEDKERLKSGDVARRHVQDVLLRMARLLPDDHRMKKAHAEASPIEELAGSRLE